MAKWQNNWTIKDYAAAVGALKNERKIQVKKSYAPLWLERGNSNRVVYVRQYNTRILAYLHERYIVINTVGPDKDGPWRSDATKRAINAFLPEGWRLNSVGGKWILHNWNHMRAWAFDDGMSIDLHTGNATGLSHRSGNQQRSELMRDG